MAVTKIWPIRKSFAAPIDYVQNSEKTANPAIGNDSSDMSEEAKQVLEDVIEYASNEDKTEMKYFVSTLNCKQCFELRQVLKNDADRHTSRSHY